MVLEHRAGYAARWDAIQSIAAKMGFSRETLTNTLGREHLLDASS